MPIARIDDHGTELYYEDSGAASGAYTTVVMVHGSCFNGGVFSRMFAHAPASGLRLVAVNRREYRGSTPLPEDELDALRGGDVDAGRQFLRRRNLEITRFLVWFLQKETIPRLVSEDQGGLVVLGWSSGWAHVAPLLAYADEMPREIIEALTPYLKGICAFDAPRLVTGLPIIGTPQTYYSPFFDENLSFNDYCAFFANWVTSYYAHPGVRTRSHDGLAEHGVANPPPSMATIPPDVVCVPAVARIERNLHRAPREIFLGTTRRVFQRSEAWARCKVYVVWCEDTLWECVAGGWQLEDVRKGMDEGREMVIVGIPGANHLVQWDNPELTCRVLADCFGRRAEKLHLDARFDLQRLQTKMLFATIEQSPVVRHYG